jgi:hypothetical protein
MPLTFRYALGSLLAAAFLLTEPAGALSILSYPPDVGWPLRERVAHANLILLGKMTFLVPKGMAGGQRGIVGIAVDSLLVGVDPSARPPFAHGAEVRALADTLPSDGYTKQWFSGQRIWFLRSNGSELMLDGQAWPAPAPTTIQEADSLLARLRSGKGSSREIKALETYLTQQQEGLPFAGGPFMNITPVPDPPAGR